VEYATKNSHSVEEHIYNILSTRTVHKWSDHKWPSHRT